MSRERIFGVMICLAVMLTTHASIAKNEFLAYRVATEHYEIYHNVSEERAQLFARFFEAFHQRFEADYFQLELPKKVVIYVMSDSASYRQFVGNDTADADIYGFRISDDPETLVVNLDMGIGVAVNMLVHHFLDVHMSPNVPLWVKLGIVSYFEKLLAYENAAGEMLMSFGYFSQWRFPEVQRNVEKLRLYKLFLFPEYHRSAGRSLMVFLRHEKKLQPFVRKVMSTQGAFDVRQVLAEVYGQHLRVLERDWRAWVGRQRMADVKLLPVSFVKSYAEWKQWWPQQVNEMVWDQYMQRFRATTASEVHKKK